jgi:hypothetical protein
MIEPIIDKGREAIMGFLDNLENFMELDDFIEIAEDIDKETEE